MKFVAVSCLHAPITSETYFNWLMRLLEEVKPDAFINLGDWYEAKPSKKWPKWSDETWTILDEHRAVARQANEINQRVGLLKVWLYGNHDFNQFGNAPDRIQDDLREAIHWRENKSVAPALADWNVIESYTHRTKYRLGQITCQHGCGTSINEKRLGYLYGVPYGLYMCGHSHAAKSVTQAQDGDVRLPYWFCNPGSGADFDRLHYMAHNSMHKWSHGAIVGEVSDSSVSNSKAFYGSPQWSAELRIESWAH
jgi:predicted phosphodiesterase